MEVLSLIQAVVNSLNSAPNTTLSEIVQVINTLTSFVETLHKHQAAVNASQASPSAAQSSAVEKS